MSNFLGYKWLAEHLDIVAVQPLAVESQLGRSRRTHVAEALRQETYPASAQLQPTIAAHLTFAFKHGYRCARSRHLFCRDARAECAQVANPR